jgi:hypothetical protein
MPSVGAPKERLADWMEVQALILPSARFSRADLASALGISGSADSQDDPDDSDEQPSQDEIVEAAVESVFAELDDRQKATGGEAGCYPFDLSGELLETRADPAQSVYSLLMLLGHWTKEKSSVFKTGAKLLERLSAEAARNYISGRLPIGRSHVFGSPRTEMAKGFPDALKQLCRDLGEGRGPCPNRPKIFDKNDANLDIVAWTSFPDGREGKLIAFGQCASGIHWKKKRSDLTDTADWWKTWIQDPVAVKPMKMFFVPHRVEPDEWFETCALAGVLFDRCRIAYFAAEPPDALRVACSDWTSLVLAQLRAS